LNALLCAVEHAHQDVDVVLAKARLWQHCTGLALNERQINVLNRVLDGFEGKLTISKWAALAKCSPDTALRDINELMAHGVLSKSGAGGRSTSYTLAGLEPREAGAN
jgi:Fic family protein